jgi:hypothetical protein
MAIKFERITPGKLAEAAIVPQVLDNQWVPKQLLPEMINKGKGLTDGSIKSQREKYVRKEWRRALVYGEQVVVNRAFMFNNDIVLDDYDDKISRLHFQALLNDRVIIPYLFNEESPDQKPVFTIGDKKWNAWLEILNESYPACVRLNWDDQKLDFERMSSAFHRYIKSLDTPGMPEGLASYLGIPTDGLGAFKKRIFEVVDFVTRIGREDKFVTRNMLYSGFVTAPGTPVDSGMYGNGLFSAELKQIFDLKYNINLPDALGRYALTPEDSLPRSALGDLSETLRMQSITENNIQDILRALRQIAFEKVSKGLYLENLATLSLEDVAEIRKMHEWEKYIQSVRSLLQKPFDFLDRSTKVYANFESLNRAISRRKEEQLTKKWDPWIKLTLALGLSAVEILINPSDPSQKMFTKLGTGFVSAGFTPFLMRFTISAFNKKSNADLDVSLDFMRGTINNGQEAWKEIIGRISSLSGFKELEKAISEAEDANQSIPETQSGDRYELSQPDQLNNP